MQNSQTNITVYFVRHGQSLGNLNGDAMSTAIDDPLTDRGAHQATATAKWFKKKNIPITAIYSSSFKRSLDTARAIAAENEFSVENIVGVDSLVELSVGNWAQKKISEVITPEVEFALNAKGIDFAWPQGESFRMVERRAAEWTEREILHNPKYASGERHVVIVSHGNTIRALLYYILGCDDRLVHRFAIDNCALSIFNYKKYGWHPFTISSTEHLS